MAARRHLAMSLAAAGPALAAEVVPVIQAAFDAARPARQGLEDALVDASPAWPTDATVPQRQAATFQLPRPAALTS